MADLYNLLDGLEEDPTNNSHSDEEPQDTLTNVVASPDENEGEDWAPAVPVMVEPPTKPVVTEGPADPLSLDALMTESAARGENMDRPYRRIQRWWMQECKSPDLLPYDGETFQEVTDSLEQDDGDEELTKLGLSSNLQAIFRSVFNVDRERIQHLLADLSRVRLEKIEQQALYLAAESEPNLLSSAEAEYLQGYIALIKGHLRSTVLDHIDDAFDRLDEPAMIDPPNTDRYVFLRVRVHDTEIPGGNEPFKSGTSLIAPYRSVREAAREGRVELI